MNASFLAEKFTAALPYDRYVRTGTEEQQRRWQQVHTAAQLTETRKQLVAGFVRNMKVLIVSGIWCGDCVQQCPLLQRIAEANAARIDLRCSTATNIAIWRTRCASMAATAYRWLCSSPRTMSCAPSSATAR